MRASIRRTPIELVDAESRRRVWSMAARQLQANLGQAERRTHPAGLAVYGRRGQPCHRCGTPVAHGPPRRPGAQHLLVPDAASPSLRNFVNMFTSGGSAGAMAVVPKVVVVGAGFGGLEVARHLKGAPVEVTLVDRNNFHTFQPLLYQVATAGLNAADVAHVVRGVFHGQRNLRFRQATVTGRRLGRHGGAPRRPARPAVRPPRAGRRGHRHPLRHSRAPPSTASRSTRSTTP